MATYKAKRRFFQRGETIQVGDEIELDQAAAYRFARLGYVEGPMKKPRRARKVKRDKPTD